MTEENAPCPVCGERLAIKGLSFFMINGVVEKHSKAGRGCELRVEFFPDENRVEIKKAVEGDAEATE